MNIMKICYHRLKVSLYGLIIFYIYNRLEVDGLFTDRSGFFFYNIADKIVRYKKKHETEFRIKELLDYCGSFPHEHTIALLKIKRSMRCVPYFPAFQYIN